MLTPIFARSVVKDDVQASVLRVAAGSDGAVMQWSKMWALRRDIGVAGVDIEGEPNYAREIPLQEQEYPAAMGIIDGTTAVMALSRYKLPGSSSEPKDQVDLTLRIIKNGRFSGKPLIIDGAEFLVNEDPDHFSLFWEDSQNVIKRQSFEVAHVKNGTANGQALKRIGAPVTVVKREGLAAVDANGNLYFLTLRRTRDMGKHNIIVAKTDRDGRILFEDLLVAKRAHLGKGPISPSPRLIAGTSSFTVVWGPWWRNAKKIGQNLQQVSASGELLGDAVGLQDRGPGGLRIRMTHGEAVVDDIYASTRRQLRPLLGSRELSRSELEKLRVEDEPLFTEIGARDNKDILQTAMDFMNPSSKTPYGTRTTHSIKDSRGNDLDADLSRVSTDTILIELGGRDPMIMIDFYQEGRLLKTINLGRGEDVALASYDDELVAVWTGGDGWVDLRVGRWRLKAGD